MACFALAGCSLARADRSPFDSARAWRDLEAIVAIGARIPGSAESAKTADYLERSLAAADVQLEKYAFTAYTPLGRRSMTNLAAVSKGTRPGIIIVSGHYDTKYLPYINFTGANDGGSSTALLLELARNSGPARQGYSIWFCWFDGEEAFVEWTDEDSLYGSREMVNHLERTGALGDVKALINVDMIGDCDLNVLRDPEAPVWLLDAIWDSTVEAGSEGAFSWTEQAMQDDHAPFRAAGIPSINLIDFEYGANRFEHDQNWHTERDTLERVCADSLQTVGDVLYRALPRIERHLIDAEGDSADAG